MTSVHYSFSIKREGEQAGGAECTVRTAGLRRQKGKCRMGYSHHPWSGAWSGRVIDFVLFGDLMGAGIPIPKGQSHAAQLLWGGMGWE